MWRRRAAIDWCPVSPPRLHTHIDSPFVFPFRTLLRRNPLRSPWPSPSPLLWSIVFFPPTFPSIAISSLFVHFSLSLSLLPPTAKDGCFFFLLPFFSPLPFSILFLSCFTHDYLPPSVLTLRGLGKINDVSNDITF